METLTKLFESRLDAFLERTGLKPSTFGLQATGDPNLVRQLRRGRSPTLATADQILAFMEAFDEARLNPASHRSDPLRNSSRRERNDRATGRTIARRVDVPGRILRMPDVQARTGLSRSAIYRRISKGRFPKPVARAGNAVGWVDEELDGWIHQQIAASCAEDE